MSRSASKTAVCAESMRAERVRPRVLLIASCAILFFAFANSSFAQEQSEKAMPTVRTVVPVAGHVPGIGNVEWHSDLTLANDTQADIEVVLSYWGDPSHPFLMTSVAAGESMVFEDIAAETFGVAPSLGMLVVDTFGTGLLHVTASAYAFRDGHRFPLQPIATIEPSTRLASTQKLTGLVYSNEYRTNIGLANLGSKEVTITLALQRLEGRNLSTETVVLAPESLLQTPIEELFPSLSHGSRLIVVADAPVASFYAYASVIENATHRARFVKSW